MTNKNLDNKSKNLDNKSEFPQCPLFERLNPLIKFNFLYGSEKRRRRPRFK